MGKYWMLVSVLGPILLTSCGAGGYRGYMTRAYTIKGVRYHPMSVEQALRYEETGYEQAPYEPISKETYEELITHITPIEKIETDEEGKGTKFCTNDTCTLF